MNSAATSFTKQINQH